MVRTLTVLGLRPQVHARRVLMLRTVERWPDRILYLTVFACLDCRVIRQPDAIV